MGRNSPSLEALPSNNHLTYNIFIQDVASRRNIK